MSKRALFIILVVSSVMLTVGGGATYALPATESKLSAPALAAADNTIGYNFTIANESTLTETCPAVAYNPDREEYLVVWYNDRAGNDDIQAQRVSKDGALVGGAFYVAATNGERRHPDVAYNSQQGQYLVVWEFKDATWGFNGISGRRVSGTGTVLDSSDIEIRSAGSLYTPSDPAVTYASTSGKYLVVWQETWHPSPLSKDIVGQLVTGSGTLDGTDFTISYDTGSGAYREDPDVAYCRTRNEFLVVWRQRNTSSDYNIYARRVSGSGDLLNPASINISTLGHDETAPAVAALPLTSNEGDYLVAWEINTGSDTGIDAKTVHVASDGTVTVGSLPLIVYDGAENESNPAVAGNESSQQYLVTWSQHYSIDIGGGLFYVYDGIAGKAVASDGNLLNSTLMDPGTALGGLSADNSAVAAGPLGDFLVVFDDTALSSSRGIYGQLWGNRIYLPLVLRSH